MQLLKIDENLRLSTLSDIVGSANVPAVLHENSLPRTPNIGQAFKQSVAATQSEDIVSQVKKVAIINSFTEDSDIFQRAALSSDDDWKCISSKGTFPDSLKIPSTVKIPDAVDVLGNGQSVSNLTYSRTIDQMLNPPYRVDPATFNEYSAANPSSLTESVPGEGNGNVFQWFHIPWGKITLYSSLAGEQIEFPVYPQGLNDAVTANYTQMPDMIYQYEPWMVYQSSGPRSNTFRFDMHRDMWTGDHRDGKANELIRFCEANCYPEYDGSAVNTSTVTLYISGNAMITGVMTEVSVEWDGEGPIGIDGWFLHFVLEISIVEVSPEPLSFSKVRTKPLIG